MAVITEKEFVDMFGGGVAQPTLVSETDRTNRAAASFLKGLLAPVRWTGELTGSPSITEAGQNLEGRVDKAYPVDPSYSGFGRDLVSGAGSMASFMVPGGVVGAGPKAAAGLAALFGSANQGLAGLDESRQQEAPPEQQRKSFLLNSALGTSEALPIGRFFGRAQPMAHEVAGGLTDALARFIKSSAKGAAEEGAQEGLQQLGQNVIASDLAGYDPNRKATEDVGYNMLIGSILGAPVSGAAHMIGEARTDRAGQDGPARPPGPGINGEILPPEALPPGPEPVQPEPVTIDGEIVRPEKPAEAAGQAPEQASRSFDFTKPLDGESAITIVDPTTGTEEEGFWHEATNRVRRVGEPAHASVLDTQNTAEATPKEALGTAPEPAQKPAEAAASENIASQPAQTAANTVSPAQVDAINRFLLPAPESPGSGQVPGAAVNRAVGPGAAPAQETVVPPAEPVGFPAQTARSAPARDAPLRLIKRPAAATLISRGGVHPDSQLGQDIRAAGIRVPGLLNRRTGKSFDNIPRSEVDFMRQSGDADLNGYVSPDEWIAALEAENTGQPYRSADEIAQEKAAAPETDADMEAAHAEAMQIVESEFRDGGIDQVPDDIHSLVGKGIRYGLSPQDAADAAMIEHFKADPAVDAAMEHLTQQEIDDFLQAFGYDMRPKRQPVADQLPPFFEETGNDQTADVRRDGKSAPENPEGAAGTGQPEGARRAEVLPEEGRPATEPGAEGKPQLVIPGAGPASDAELARRRAAEPLKPKAEQKPADEGLFSDQSKQIDITDLLLEKDRSGNVPRETSGNGRETGKFAVQDRNRIGEEVRAYVTEKGRADGNEHLVMIGADGSVIDENSGDNENVKLTAAMIRAVMDPASSVVIHHNHPGSTALSGIDISQLAGPGLRSVYAHGHDGTTTRASLTPRLREAALKHGRDRAARFIKKTIDLIETAVKKKVRALINDGTVKVDDANRNHADVMNRILEAGGMIDYHTEFDDAYASRPEIADIIETAARALRPRLEGLQGNGQASADNGTDRSTATVRHPGEMGGLRQEPREYRGQRDQAHGREGGQGEHRPAEGGAESRAGQRRFRENDVWSSLGEESANFEEPPATANWSVPDRSTFSVLRDSNLSLSQRLRQAASKEAMQASLDNWRIGFQDRFLPMMRVEQAIEKATGSELPEGMKVYLAEELYTGRVGSRIDRLQRRYVEPIASVLREFEISQEEIGDYLYARHAVERNAHIAGINESFPDGGSGMTDAEARAVLDKVARHEHADAFEFVGKLVDRMLRESVRARVDGGLLSEQEAEAWQRYKHYVPLRGFEEIDEGDPGIPHVGKGYTVSGRESRQALGRKSRAADILATSFTLAQEAVIRAEKNRVLQRLYDLAKAHPNKAYWEINPVRMKQVFNKATGMVYRRPESPILAKDADRTVSVKFNGVEHRIVLHDARLREAVKRLNPEDINGILRFLITTNRFLSMMNTSMNPEFVISNAIRDLQTAAVHMQALDVDGVTKNVLKDYFPAMAGAFGGVHGRQSSDWQKWYRRFDRAGGRVNFFRMERVEDFRAKFDKIAKQMSAKDPRQVWRALKALGTEIENLNLAVDNAVRLSLFKNMVERGVSDDKAASAAKNLTVNFNRRGEHATAMNAMYLFYNAGVQGSAIMINALRHKRARQLAGAMIGSGLALALLNALFLTDRDENGESEYSKIPEWEKERNLIVMAPWRNENGSQGYFKFPLPYGYNVFWGIGRNVAEYGAGLKDGASAIGDLATTFIDAFNPVGGSQSITTTLSPTVLDPFVEIKENRDFAGRKIRPGRTNYDPNIPFSQDYYNSVSPMSRWIATMLNQWTGGNEFKAGKIDVSPEWIDHAAKFMGGAAAAFAGRIVNDISKIGRGEEITTNDIPFARKIYGQTGAFFERGIFYDRVDEIEKAYAQVNGFRKAGNRKAYEALDERTKVLGGMRTSGFRSMMKRLRDIRQKRNEVYSRPYDAATRSQLLKRLEDEEMKIIRSFNRSYLRAVARAEN